MAFQPAVSDQSRSGCGSIRAKARHHPPPIGPARQEAVEVEALAGPDRNRGSSPVRRQPDGTVGRGSPSSGCRSRYAGHPPAPAARRTGAARRSPPASGGRRPVGGDGIPQHQHGQRPDEADITLRPEIGFARLFGQQSCLGRLDRGHDGGPSVFVAKHADAQVDLLGRGSAACWPMIRSKGSSG